MFHFTPPQTNRCKSVSTKGWSYFRMATTEAVTFFRLRGTRRKILKNDTSSGLAPDKNFFFFSCLCPFILLPDPPPHNGPKHSPRVTFGPRHIFGPRGALPRKTHMRTGGFSLGQNDQVKSPPFAYPPRVASPVGRFRPFLSRKQSFLFPFWLV